MNRRIAHLRYTLALAICFAVAIVFSVNGEAADFKKEYKMQINVGPQFYWGMGAQKFSDLVKERTNGQINIKPYWGSSLLKGAQLKSAQLVANGVIDCAMESTINISPVITEANIFSLPFFINNFENLDKMEYGETGKAIFKAMDAKGLVGLAWAENGFRQVTNSKLAIRTPADVKGLRLRVVGSPIFIDTFRQLGADPVNMNWGDAVTAFGQGVVDGQENPVGVLVPVQIWQYHKYATFWNYLVDPVIIYWNKKQWNQFPPDIQKAIKDSAEEAGIFEKALCRAGLDGDKSLNLLKDRFNHTMEVPEPVKFMESKGMTVTFLTDDERNAFIDATKPLYEKWVPKIGQALYKQAMADMAN
ncbi:MAG: DctP family TRAP transporter solute-binding subunit [Desulfobacteraceae bacterium]|jgi:tripartite ATP-independent transporter DctP family solute receptor|nr:DctP family TRAP transporter solute-binding subunit [Desulfobacteraceae bacterium]